MMADAPAPLPVEVRYAPARPYSLALSAGGLGCATRRFRHGLLDIVLRTPAGPGRAHVRQDGGGDLVARILAPDAAAAHDALRDALAVDVDLRPFLALAEADALLAPAAARLRGYRPMRLGSVAHALLRGVTGQLVRSKEARRMERAVVRMVGTSHLGLWLAPSTDELRRVTAAQLRGAGLAETRARALVRAAREIDLDGLASLPTEAVVARLTRMPGIGPWTAAVVATKGLGRLDAGPVADLGLMRLIAQREGRMPDVAETARLLDRYAPYQALAGAYLLHAHPAAHTGAAVAEVARASRRFGAGARYSSRRGAGAVR